MICICFGELSDCGGKGLMESARKSHGPGGRRLVTELYCELIVH